MQVIHINLNFSQSYQCQCIAPNVMRSFRAILLCVCAWKTCYAKVNKNVNTSQTTATALFIKCSEKPESCLKKSPKLTAWWRSFYSTQCRQRKNERYLPLSACSSVIDTRAQQLIFFSNGREIPFKKIAIFLLAFSIRHSCGHWKTNKHNLCNGIKAIKMYAFGELQNWFTRNPKMIYSRDISLFSILF